MNRGISWGIAASLLVASVVWMVATVADDENRRLFFGLWRMRHLAVSTVAILLSALFISIGISRKATFSLLLASLIGLSTVFLLEIVGAFGLVSYPEAFGQDRTVLGSQAKPNLDIQGETFQDLAHKYGYPSEAIPFHYVTDRHGFRNAEDRGDADLYFLGDSILVAGLLPFEQTLTSLLEEELEVRTKNIALIGLSPQEERDIFEELQLPLKQRLVLHFLFEGNDLLDSANYRSPKEKKRKSRFRSTFSYNLLMAIQDLTDQRKLNRDRKIGRIDTTNYLFSWTDRSYRGVENEFEPICETILGLRETIESLGGTYAIVYVPAKIRVVGPFCQFPPESAIQEYQSHLSPLREWMSAWCLEQDVPLLDLTDSLIESAAAGAIPWFPGDTHPNAIGHRTAANAIKAWLSEVQWTTPACKTNQKPAAP